MSENLIFSLHGFLGQASDWSAIEKNLQLTSKFDFRAEDLFSKSSVPILEFEDYIEILSKKIDAYKKNSEKKVFVGYSLGGRLGLHLLRNNPEQFDHYVFVSTHPGLGEDEQSERNKRLMVDMKWASLISEGNWANFISDWNKQPVFENSVGEAVRHYDDYDIDKLKRALVIWSVSQQEDFRELIQDFQSKITWVVGERDGIYLRRSEDMLQKKILLNFKRIASGHRILLEQPLEISNLLSSLF